MLSNGTMSDRESASELLTCAECGNAVSQFETFCAITDVDVLCWDCALRRGGSYDVEAGRWTVMPDHSDLVRGRGPKRHPHAHG